MNLTEQLKTMSPTRRRNVEELKDAYERALDHFRWMERQGDEYPTLLSNPDYLNDKANQWARVMELMDFINEELREAEAEAEAAAN